MNPAQPARFRNTVMGGGSGEDLVKITQVVDISLPINELAQRAPVGRADVLSLGSYPDFCAHVFVGRLFLASEYLLKQIRAQFVFSMQQLFDITRLQFSSCLHSNITRPSRMNTSWVTNPRGVSFWRCDVNFVQLIE